MDLKSKVKIKSIDSTYHYFLMQQKIRFHIINRAVCSRYFKITGIFGNDWNFFYCLDDCSIFPNQTINNNENEVVKRLG
jgi:hypothetical protein